MSAEMAQKLVQGGIKAVRNGETELARKAFTQALKLDPDNEAAWLGMATITEGTADKIRILNKILEINPDNESAQEALSRLRSDDPKPGTKPFSVEVDDLGAFDESTFDMDDSNIFSESIYESDEIPLPPLPEEQVDEATNTGLIESLDLDGLPIGDTGELADFPEPSSEIDNMLAQSADDIDEDGFLADMVGDEGNDFLADVVEIQGDIIEEDPVEQPEPEPESEPEPEYVGRSSEEAFARLNVPALRGEGGIPFIPQNNTAEMSEEVSAKIQAYLEDALADYLTPEYEWTRKSRGRAGSSEYRSLLLQVGTALAVAIFIVGGGLAAFIATNATAQRVLFGPTNTPVASPTVTPTSTPGVTNTPSPTPATPASETPMLLSSVTLGNPDPNFPPTATAVYYPVDQVDSIINEALFLMQDNELDEAKDLLDDAVANEELTGAFPPFYRLSQWHLFNDDPDEAREVLTDWQDEWEDRDSILFENSQALLLIGLARVDIYEANNGIGGRDGLIADAQERLEASIGLAEGDDVIPAPDRVNPDAYILLAESYVLDGEVDTALDILSDGLRASFDDRSLYGNTDMRLTRARILAEDDRIAEALQELYFVLELDPFLEEALIMQIELALDSEQAGLAVLYAQQYLLYYPGSLQGFYLLGQAREAENKFDLAIAAYSRALAGDRDDSNYVDDPFFLEVLLARADLYVQQGQRDLASEDYSAALSLVDDTAAIRVRRLESAYVAGNYDDVLADAEELLGSGEIAESRVLYYQGLTLVDLATSGEVENPSENYDLAITALNRATALGLPSELRPIAREYLAVANLAENNLDSALTAINSAINSAGVTGNRVYLRGRILEAQARRTGRTADFQAALEDYEFVLTWGQFYSFPFIEDAQERYDDIIRDALGQR